MGVLLIGLGDPQEAPLDEVPIEINDEGAGVRWGDL